MLDTIHTKIWHHNSKLKIRKMLDEDLNDDPEITPAVIEVLRESENNNENAIEVDDASIADDEVPIKSKVLCVVLGVYFNLITKKITALNIENWYKGRIRAYSRNTQGDEDKATYSSLRPSVKFSEAVNSGVAGCFKFKRCVF